MGYRAGNKGISEQRRRREILNYIFENEIPQVRDGAYMNEWGRPQTSSRLQKLAQCLAGFASTAKRNSSANLSTAIARWESDLQYLRQAFYQGRFDFPWPDTNDRG
jgi:hypothetical protein